MSAVAFVLGLALGGLAVAFAVWVSMGELANASLLRSPRGPMPLGTRSKDELKEWQRECGALQRSGPAAAYFRGMPA